jgi:transposase InsO family protein
MEDRRGKLGLRGRRELVRVIEQGHSMRQAARSVGVSPATAHRWWHRWRRASEADRASLSCLASRPPTPRSCPWQLDEAAERRILAARARTNLGPARLAGLVGYRRSTIWKVLARNGCSRRRRSERPLRPTRRYEWAEPGALLHMDAKQLTRFERPGHWAHGDRSEQHRNRGIGIEYAHCVVDDRSRLAYVEVHRHDRAEIAAAVLGRAIAWFAAQGCGPTEALMTDNALVYIRGNALAGVLEAHGVRHIRIPPRTPRWNGKVERFIRTLDEEWAHARIWPTSAARNRALASWMRYYNRRRPHTALGDRPPLSRVHQERGQNI